MRSRCWGLQQLKLPQNSNDPSSDTAKPQMTTDSKPGLQYPKGVVKRTWAFKFDRTGDDVKLEEVLEPLWSVTVSQTASKPFV